jgi:hypothetical protein
MADELNEVRPGDRITAELINTLIRRVKNPGGGEGTISVPNVFGLNLGVARNSLTGAGLTVGSVLDTSGASVDHNATPNHTRLIINQVPEPGAYLSSGQAVSLTVTAQAAGSAGVLVPDLFGQTLSAAKTLATSAGLSVSSGYDPYGSQVDLSAAALQSRLVLAQLPAPETRVNAGTPLRLVLSAEAVAGPPPGSAVRISAIHPSIAPIRSEIQIFGTNFSPNMGDNVVMFNGIRAQQPSPQSTASSLFVVIPDMDVGLIQTLPGLGPSETGGTEIFVTVVTPNGQSSERTMRVLAPLPRHLPRIHDVNYEFVSNPTNSNRGVRVAISNSTEWQNVQDVRLYFNGLPQGGVGTASRSTGNYSFPIPASSPGLDTSVGQTVLLRLRLDGYLSPAFSYTFTF